MKKSTILIICIVFLASVLVVGFFGMQAESYYSKVYVESIKPAAIYCSTDEQLSFMESDTPNRYPVMITAFKQGMIVRVDCDVSPDDATFFNDIKVEITGQGNYTGSDDNTVATLDGHNIILHQCGFVELTYRVLDGSDSYMTVVLYVVS